MIPGDIIVVLVRHVYRMPSNASRICAGHHIHFFSYPLEMHHKLSEFALDQASSSSSFIHVVCPSVIQKLLRLFFFHHCPVLTACHLLPSDCRLNLLVPPSLPFISLALSGTLCSMGCISLFRLGTHTSPLLLFPGSLLAAQHHTLTSIVFPTFIFRRAPNCSRIRL